MYVTGLWGISSRAEVPLFSHCKHLIEQRGIEREGSLELDNGGVETVQDFLIKLGIKLLTEISIFSLNNDFVRITKIMNNLVKDYKIRTFKVIFSV